jgi:glycosyltransferase involved in cell wall biosynthesis
VKVIQILPELNAGGVERGTLEVAAHLIQGGHEALVISHGGRLVGELEALGARHIHMPVHRKSLRSLFQVRPMRELLEREKPDIIHIRSRVPGWITWLAWRSMDPRTRPRLVSTVHGFYSVNCYSRIMLSGERIIAVSESVRQYILHHYPKTHPEIIRVVHRGVDDATFTHAYQPPQDWQSAWHRAQPQLSGRIPLLLPGRLTRWKGQEHFIRLIAKLHAEGLPVHGLIVGEPHAKKTLFLDELKQLAQELGIEERISFLGHRSDISHIMAMSAIVYSLSLDPEAFGRVSLEAMAIGKPVIAYNHGGVGEQLQALYPVGLVPVGDIDAAATTTARLLKEGSKPLPITPFSLRKMLDATLAVYRELCPLA